MAARRSSPRCTDTLWGLEVQSLYVLVPSILLALTLVAAVFVSAQAGDSLGIYDNALAPGWGSWSWSTTIDFSQGQTVHSSPSAIAVTYDKAWAGLYLHSDRILETANYDLLTFWIHGGPSGNQRLSVKLVDADRNFIQSQAQVVAQAGTWKKMDIPLTELGEPVSISGVVWQDSTGAAQPQFFIDDVSLVASVAVPSPTPGPRLVQLEVDPSVQIHPFSNQMLGQAMVNWEHSWGKPFPNDVPGLADAMRAAHVGLLRYAGGLWANKVGWDRVPQRTPLVEWTKNGNTYSFHYGTDEIANLAAFARNIGAEVMIQVNIARYDPGMWADMVRYANTEHNYGFKYWELGNELDFDTQWGIDPDTYAERARAYIDAMKAVDPSILIVGGVPSSAHDAARLGWSDSVTALSQYLSKTIAAVSQNGDRVDSLSYHWYQSCDNVGIEDLLRYQWVGLAYDSWRNSSTRLWSEIAPSRVQNEILLNYPSVTQGITELNFEVCRSDVLDGNHMTALWALDVIGRLAYHGLDYLTWWEGYGGQSTAAIYPDQNEGGGAPPTRVFLRPSYHAFFMYGNYFGDQLVASSSSDEAIVPMWASADSTDPSALKLMLINLSGDEVEAHLSLKGVRATSGEAYLLASANPTDLSDTSNTEAAPTTINGVKLTGLDVGAAFERIQPRLFSIGGSTFTYALPPYSAAALVLRLEGGEPIPTFVDVPLSHPYHNDIEALYRAGYTAGCNTDPLMYCPDNTMNRAESSVFVERGIHTASYNPPTPASQVFADMPPDSWAAKWVNGLWQDQYTGGCGTDPLIYCPWQGHSRAEGCVFYLRMLKGAGFTPPPPTSQIFADVPLDAWYAGWVNEAYTAGLLEPCYTTPELRFCPGDPLTRAMAAHMMVRAKGLETP